MRISKASSAVRSRVVEKVLYNNAPTELLVTDPCINPFWENISPAALYPSNSPAKAFSPSIMSDTPADPLIEPPDEVKAAIEETGNEADNSTALPDPYLLIT